MFDRFPQERVYLKGISLETLRYSAGSEGAFAPILNNPCKAGALDCIQRMRDRGVKPASIRLKSPGLRAGEQYWIVAITSSRRLVEQRRGPPRYTRHIQQ